MPRATVAVEPVRHELKTCPGGFVLLKQMPYAEMLARRDIVTRLSVSQKKGEDDLNIAMANLEANRYSFAKCIMDHNLEDEHGNKLSFTNAMTLSALDPKIGAEIEQLIDALNQEDDDEAELFTEPASSSSEVSMNPPLDTTA